SAAPCFPTGRWCWGGPRRSAIRCFRTSWGSPRVRAAEADLARAQDDLKSLSIEILERYEEASLIYRLGERLAETVEAREIAAVLLREVAGVLGAHQGEVWLGQKDQASVA